ncbi:hypothetical protein VTK56DRAFT_6742 [Thermocarpiscus australiensis]
MLNGNSSGMRAKRGNGEPDPNHKGVPQPGRTPNTITSIGGGSYVKSSPFSEYGSMVVSLGPTSMALYRTCPRTLKATARA